MIEKKLALVLETHEGVSGALTDVVLLCAGVRHTVLTARGDTVQEAEERALLKFIRALRGVEDLT